ncbi:sulfurtransferase, partial [Actinoplanes sp. RD1]|uniref:sulfurtransferase n=1 Tax=Actinoplanes sp. RD1 TaxID=3064538 RepID=UPI0027428FA6
MTSPLIRAAELAALPDVTVLDATVELAAPRFDGDHAAASGHAGWEREHLPGSRHADLLHELSDPDAGHHFAHPSPERLAAALGGLGVSDGTPVVVYDRAGGLWAARLWWLLDWIGVPARVLDGGLAAWRAAGLPVASGPADPGHGTVTPRPRAGRWVTLRDLSGFLDGTNAATVTCALNPPAYR